MNKVKIWHRFYYSKYETHNLINYYDFIFIIKERNIWIRNFLTRLIPRHQKYKIILLVTHHIKLIIRNPFLKNNIIYLIFINIWCFFYFFLFKQYLIFWYQSVFSEMIFNNESWLTIFGIYVKHIHFLILLATYVQHIFSYNKFNYNYLIMTENF